MAKNYIKEFGGKIPVISKIENLKQWKTLKKLLRFQME